MAGADEPIDGYQILEKLAALPISTWRDTSDPPTVRHLGPMAQGFTAAFGLGDDDRSSAWSTRTETRTEW